MIGWPPPLWLIAAAYVIYVSCLTGLLLIIAGRLEQARLRRAASDPLRPLDLTFADWVECFDCAAWPDREIDDEIVARQIRFARELRGHRA